MEASSSQLLHELETIRAYIFLILVIGAGLLVCVFLATTTFIGGIKELLKMNRLKNCAFREVAEDLLAQNKIDELLIEIEKRLKTHPNDAYAYYFQGKGLYFIGKYHESKRCFEKAYELESGMEVTFEIWTQRIKEKLKESSPTIVE